METLEMKNYRIRITVILFTILFTALIAQTSATYEAESAITRLVNATYSGIEDEPVTLLSGQWEGAPYVEGGASRPRVGLLEDIYFTGDLDADGQEEAVAILWQSAGGTGENVYIAVMKSDNGGFNNISTSLVGDRVKLRGGRIDSGRIILDVLQTGENDPMCCPTQLATRNWVLKDGQLEENKIEVTGLLSLSVLEGSDWVLTRMNREQTIPEDAEVTIAFSSGRVSGRSACNRYSADIKEGDNAGEIIIGPTMGTRMACPDHLMEVESRYLEALAQVTSFSFYSGKLMLNGQKEDGTHFSMVFDATGTGPQVEL